MIVSILLMELKSIASKWKNNIALISLVMAILYNRREILLVAPLLLNGKKNVAVLWMVFYPREKQRSRVVKKLETYVHLFPFFGLN